jgi:prolyl-tRNA editing enzyme YbaK/EbsC (Cys-tRNA(Pro) deacylase)
MSVDRARQHFAKFGIANRVRELDVSTATVELAAAALGCEPKLIAKTLSFLINGRATLIVAAGDCKIDNAKFKTQFGVKARMLTPDEALTLVGHAVGGVCPFGVNDGVVSYLDISLKRFETVYPACGSENSMIPLTIAELEECSGGMGWVDVCKGWGA